MSEQPKIIYDSNCKLCNQAVRFLKSGSGESGTVFFPASSNDSEILLLRYNLPEDLTDKTVILLEDQKIYIKSAAIIKALQNKGGLWKLGGMLKIIPTFIRDAIYDIVARKR
jgi:predicted DCC family thiol-disulfide oxidoreductase YuxK